MKYILAIIAIGGAITGLYFYSQEETKPTIVMQPYAILCGGEFEYYSPGESECFSITKEGHIIASTTVTIGLKYFGEISTSTNFLNVSKSIDTLADELEIFAVSMNEGDEYTVYSKIGKILMKGNDIENEVSNVIAFLKNKKEAQYEYIDARHGSSIFYK